MHLVLDVERYFVVEQKLYASKMAAEAGVMQRRPTVAISDVNVYVILSFTAAYTGWAKKNCAKFFLQ